MIPLGPPPTALPIAHLGTLPGTGLREWYFSSAPWWKKEGGKKWPAGGGKRKKAESSRRGPAAAAARLAASPRACGGGPMSSGLGDLADVLELLANLLDPSRRQHAEAMAFVEHRATNLPLLRSLAAVLSGEAARGAAFEPHRQLAGLLLLQSAQRSSDGAQFGDNYLRARVFDALEADSAAARGAAAGCVAALFPKEPAAIIGALLLRLEQGTDAGKRGALESLMRITEDSGHLLGEPAPGAADPLARLVALLLDCMRSGLTDLQARALTCVHHLIPRQPPQLLQACPALLGALSTLAQLPDAALRRSVCKALCLLVEARLDLMEAALPDVANYMLACMCDGDADLQRDACEFWIILCEASEAQTAPAAAACVTPLAEPLVHALLRSMRYSAEERAQFLGEQNDGGVPDSIADLGPLFRSGRGADGGGRPAGAAESEGELSWTLRRCAARALDVLCHHLPETILTALLPVLQAVLSSAVADAWDTEVALLALGATALKSSEFAAHLPLDDLLRCLTQRLDHECAQVRLIACWTLGRFTPLAAESGADLRPILAAIERRMEDGHKKTQECACTALCSVLDAFDPEVVRPFAMPLCAVMARACDRYQLRSLVHLFDTVAAFADCLGDYIAGPATTDELLPRLVAKLDAMAVDNPVAMPLMQCIAAVASAVGAYLQDGAGAILLRAMQRLEATMALHSQEGGSDVYFIADSIAAALDLISGIAQGLGPDFGRLLRDGAGERLVELLFGAVDFPDAGVKQSAFALVGEVPTAAPEVLSRALPGLAERLPAYLDVPNANALRGDMYHVCSTAVWCLGEAAVGLRGQPGLAAPLAERLVRIFTLDGVSLPLADAAAVAIGRLAAAVPHALVPLLSGPTATRWLQSLAGVDDARDWEAALEGVLGLVSAEPRIMCSSEALRALLVAVASWPHGEEPSPPLAANVSALVSMYRQQLSEGDWNAVLRALPQDALDRLARMYALPRAPQHGG